MPAPRENCCSSKKSWRHSGEPCGPCSRWAFEGCRWWRCLQGPELLDWGFLCPCLHPLLYVPCAMDTVAKRVGPLGPSDRSWVSCHAAQLWHRPPGGGVRPHSLGLSPTAVPPPPVVHLRVSLYKSEGPGTPTWGSADLLEQLTELQHFTCWPSRLVKRCRSGLARWRCCGGQVWGGQYLVEASWCSLWGWGPPSAHLCSWRSGWHWQCWPSVMWSIALAASPQPSVTQRLPQSHLSDRLRCGWRGWLQMSGHRHRSHGSGGPRCQELCAYCQSQCHI